MYLSPMLRWIVCFALLDATVSWHAFSSSPFRRAPNRVAYFSLQLLGSADRRTNALTLERYIEEGGQDGVSTCPAEQWDTTRSMPDINTDERNRTERPGSYEHLYREAAPSAYVLV